MDDEEFQFKCNFCEKSFFNEEILSLHIKSNHESIIEGLKQCDFCEKTYRLKNSLYAHVKMNHSKEKSHECETCAKGFPNEFL